MNALDLVEAPAIQQLEVAAVYPLRPMLAEINHNAYICNMLQRTRLPACVAFPWLRLSNVGEAPCP